MKLNLLYKIQIGSNTIKGCVVFDLSILWESYFGFARVHSKNKCMTRFLTLYLDSRYCARIKWHFDKGSTRSLHFRVKCQFCSVFKYVPYLVLDMSTKYKRGQFDLFDLDVKQFEWTLRILPAI